MCSTPLTDFDFELAQALRHEERRQEDYVSRMDLSDALTVLTQLPAAFEHFNEVHPHSGLKMKSPKEFRRHQALRCE